MEILVVILLMLVFALFVAINTLKERVTILEQRLDGFVEPGAVEIVRGGAAPRERAAEREAPSPMVADSALLAEAERAARMEYQPLQVVPEEPHETLGGLFERLVAGRLLIWLGGIALVLAAVFLIR
jgi:uncharacterized membrane protein